MTTLAWKPEFIDWGIKINKEINTTMTCVATLVGCDLINGSKKLQVVFLWFSQ
jgi:hypothetical protein